MLNCVQRFWPSSTSDTTDDVWVDKRLQRWSISAAPVYRTPTLMVSPDARYTALRFDFSHCSSERSHFNAYNSRDCWRHSTPRDSNSIGRQTDIEAAEVFSGRTSLSRQRLTLSNDCEYSTKSSIVQKMGRESTAKINM